jgi:hypothetical protein
MSRTGARTRSGTAADAQGDSEEFLSEDDEFIDGNQLPNADESDDENGPAAEYACDWLLFPSVPDLLESGIF